MANSYISCYRLETTAQNEREAEEEFGVHAGYN
jgi:hypothetical protein